MTAFNIILKNILDCRQHIAGGEDMIPLLLRRFPLSLSLEDSVSKVIEASG